MADESEVAEQAGDVDGGGTNELEGGSYEVIRARLVEQAKQLATKAEALNASRQEAFGGTELTVIANERVRTEHNCTPMDIVQVGGKLLFGYNVVLGLKQETAVTDVFSVHRFEQAEEGIDLSAVPFEELDGVLTDSTFVEHFHELYRFYKNSRLIQLSRNETKLLGCGRSASRSATSASAGGR